jgi:transcriptional regulator with XRE-family HTH domain
MGRALTYREAFANRLRMAVFLKQLREQRSIEQTEVAAEVSKRRRMTTPLTRASVSAWYRAEAIPQQETQIVLAEWLDVDPGWFMAGEASKAPAPNLPAKALSMDISQISGRWRERPTPPTSTPRVNGKATAKRR